MDADEANNCLQVPRAFIEAWFPDLKIVVSDKGMTAMALAHLVYNSLLVRLLLIREHRSNEKKDEERKNDPEYQDNLRYMRPLG